MKVKADDLAKLPTTKTRGHFDLKIDHSSKRVWLGRQNTSSENKVIVEVVVDGVWEIVEEYNG